MTIIIDACYDGFVVMAADMMWHSTAGHVGDRHKLVTHPSVPLAFGSSGLGMLGDLWVIDLLADLVGEVTEPRQLTLAGLAKRLAHDLAERVSEEQQAVEDQLSNSRRELKCAYRAPEGCEGGVRLSQICTDYRSRVHARRCTRPRRSEGPWRLRRGACAVFRSSAASGRERRRSPAPSPGNSTCPTSNSTHCTGGPGWTAGDDAVMRDRVAQVIAGDASVIDGNYWRKIGGLVWTRADTVVWLDPSWLLTFFRVRG